MNRTFVLFIALLATTAAQAQSIGGVHDGADSLVGGSAWSVVADDAEGSDGALATLNGQPFSDVFVQPVTSSIYADVSEDVTITLPSLAFSDVAGFGSHVANAYLTVGQGPSTGDPFEPVTGESQLECRIMGTDAVSGAMVALDDGYQITFEDCPAGPTTWVHLAISGDGYQHLYASNAIGAAGVEGTGVPLGDGFTAAIQIEGAEPVPSGLLVLPDGDVEITAQLHTYDGTAWVGYDGGAKVHFQHVDGPGYTTVDVTLVGGSGDYAATIAAEDLPRFSETPGNGFDVFVSTSSGAASHLFLPKNALIAQGAYDEADLLEGPAPGDGQPMTPVFVAHAEAPGIGDGFTASIEIADSQPIAGGVVVDSDDITVQADLFELDGEWGAYSGLAKAHIQYIGEDGIVTIDQEMTHAAGGQYTASFDTDDFAQFVGTAPGNGIDVFISLPDGRSSHHFTPRNALLAAEQHDLADALEGPASEEGQPSTPVFLAQAAAPGVGDGFTAQIDVIGAEPVPTGVVVIPNAGSITVRAHLYDDAGGWREHVGGATLHLQYIGDADVESFDTPLAPTDEDGVYEATIDVRDLPSFGANATGNGYDLFISNYEGQASHYFVPKNAAVAAGQFDLADAMEGPEPGQGQPFTPLLIKAAETVLVDPDGDGVQSDPSDGILVDVIGDDNCPTTHNPEQDDLDSDGQGDACDDDDDGDGTPDSVDAFPRNGNETKDTDDDGIGNNADTDDDNDGVPDDEDAFPEDPDESSDADDDGVGDNADADDDNDGVDDQDDNCPFVANNDQADLDGDGTGDACDDDRDGDGVDNDDDAFPDDDSESADSDGDGTGDNADAFPDDANETADQDGDGVGDNSDNCPAVANAAQVDADDDGIGDACQSDPPTDCPDADDDGTCDADDAFPGDASEDTDSDGDGIGDNADAFPDDASESSDADSDGIGDNADNCPSSANNAQGDQDGDGIGDVCDDDRDGDGVDNDDDAYPLDASESADSDNDGVGDNADLCPGHDDNADRDGDGTPNGCDVLPDDADADGYDRLALFLSRDVAATLRGQAVRTDDGVTMRLRFDADDRADGYQVWRSTSPYQLIATLPGNATGYEDAESQENATYIVTAFVERDGIRYGHADEPTGIAYFDKLVASGDTVTALVPEVDGDQYVLVNGNPEDEEQTLRIDVYDEDGELIRSVNQTYLVPAGGSVNATLDADLEGGSYYEVVLETSSGESVLAEGDLSEGGAAVTWIVIGAVLLVAIIALAIVGAVLGTRRAQAA